MPLKHLVLGLAIVATIPTAFTTAGAADGLYVPLLTYRTGPFAGSGIPYANGLTDYLNMLNQRERAGLKNLNRTISGVSA